MHRRPCPPAQPGVLAWERPPMHMPNTFVGSPVTCSVSRSSERFALPSAWMLAELPVEFATAGPQ